MVFPLPSNAGWNHLWRIDGLYGNFGRLLGRVRGRVANEARISYREKDFYTCIARHSRCAGQALLAKNIHNLPNQIQSETMIGVRRRP